MLKTFEIIITGQVQGVGFRPFVFALAKEFGLVGTVSNNENGVIIFLTGNEKIIQSFYQKLLSQPPPVSYIQKSFLREADFIKFQDFNIVPSAKKGKLNLTLTPDFAICETCKSEMEDPENRRFQYPFTTCVNCGPRWAITKTFPFERAHTSMHFFEMCEVCQGEYTNPGNRRFYSQTNSCKTCGIEMYLSDGKGYKLDVSREKIFQKMADILKQGYILAIKNTSGYLLCCDANNAITIQNLRKKKNRPHKPFAVLYPNLAVLEQQLPINAAQKRAFQSAQRPIVIVPKKNFKGQLALEEIAPNLNDIGLMLPYSAILQLLATTLNQPIIATSGNLHGSPILSDNFEAEHYLSPIADYFLHHNLQITNPQDDSVIKFSANFNQEVLFRRSRGYAPNYFTDRIPRGEKILALGSHLKSTIAFLPNDYLYVSQYLGNLDNFEVYQRFVQTSHKFLHLFEQNPDVILTDSHPGYLSSQFGKELSKELGIKNIAIQHHKAHFTSVMGEHQLFDGNEPVLGVIWDGTGYGEDGKIWGGEFFTYRAKKIERIAHFEYFDWLASDKMAKEPRLSLLSLAEVSMRGEIAQKFEEKEFEIYQALLKNNQLKTSSVGRLFDAVASLLNICDFNTYEGEAAILLENYALNYNLHHCKSYCEITEDLKIPTKSILKDIYSDLKKGVPKENIITNFFYTLCTIIFDLAERQNINKIALSGGVFQNTTLIDMLKELGGKEVQLFFNRNLAPNDENISFGQIMYYLHCKNDFKS